MSEHDDNGHTPGLTDCRWTIKRDRHGKVRIVADPNPYDRGRQNGAEFVIADEIVSFRDTEEQEVFARLIASAPALRSALQRAVAELRRVKVCLSETTCEELEQVQAECEKALEESG